MRDVLLVCRISRDLDRPQPLGVPTVRRADLNEPRMHAGSA